MKWIRGVVVIAIALNLSACSSATADNEGADARPAPSQAARVTLPAGTTIRVTLSTGVGTDSSAPGSEFTATLAEPILVNGKTVFKRGAEVVGRVIDVQKPGRVKGRASLSLELASIDHEGKAIAVDTQTYVGVARSTTKRDATVIGGAAGLGAAVGAITGGGKGAAAGAAIGGGSGTGVVLATRGDDLHYPPETRLTFVLAKAATL
ncbi:MAG TPA: hypothetical protein VFY29_02055 [Terriglobia bacterium]|nr:hypothetical protein [Terriglobia bacterium]